jgi:hypothetical protein
VQILLPEYFPVLPADPHLTHRNAQGVSGNVLFAVGSQASDWNFAKRFGRLAAPLEPTEPFRGRVGPATCGGMKEKKDSLSG